MSSTYPGTLDSFAINKGDSTDETSGSPTGGSAGDHAAHHNNLADAVNKIEAELGTNPSGSAATVAAALGGVNFGLVTGLPGSPATGDRCTYTDSLTVPTFYWQLVYNGSDSGSYKWAVVGGSPMTAEVLTDESTTSATYAALTTAGPSVTLPLDGDYDITPAAEFYHLSTAGVLVMSYDIGGTGAVDADAVTIAAATAQLGNTLGDFSRTRRKTGLAAATAIVSKYKRITAGTAHFLNRRIEAMPVRVG